MEVKQVRPGAAAAFKGLELADKQIADLQKRHLPYDPHLLSVPIKHPIRDPPSHENNGTPFADYEVVPLQHMTMISASRRGVARAEGDWQARIESGSPASLAARSNTTTPNHTKEVKIPSKKISLGDYKNYKKTGIKPSPRPADGDGKPGHTRNTSAVSIGTPMSRVPSFEGALEVKQNGASELANSAKLEKPVMKENARSAATSNSIQAKTNTPTTNGHVERPSNALGINNKAPPPPKSHLPQIRETIKHQLPPRPQSPPRKTYDVKPSEIKKRPLELADRQPEKRTKIEHSRIPSGSQNHLPRKAETSSETKPSPIKNHKSTYTPSRDSPLPKKGTPDVKSTQAKGIRSEKPRPLPEKLAPLPDDLFNLATPKKTESKSSTPNNSFKHNHDPDTIVVKGARVPEPSPVSTPSKSPKHSESSRSSSPLLPLPKMLSDTLPPIIEEELARISARKAAKDAAKNSSQNSSQGESERLQSKELSLSASRDTVGARYEEVRRPNVPGVARKTVTPKVGHPPKKAPGESSKARPSNEKESLIMKLKYKKRRAKDVSRILGIQAKPSKEFLKLEKERRTRLNPSRAESESEDEMPLSTITAKAAPKKRPSEAIERTEPATKRAKLPDSIDISKAKTALEPAFKSPAPSAPSQKNLLSTPKRGDAMKTVAMRKVGSNDGSARTPQTMSTSTPASAEKPRANGDVRPPVDERLKAESHKADEAAIKLKRKMDEILQSKGKGFDSVSETQRKLGLAVGIECVTMYMTSFVLKDRLNKSRSVGMWETSRGLWEYIERFSRSYPILHALNSQLGAVLKQEVGRVYVETLPKNLTDQGFLKSLADNSMKCDQLWREVHRARPVLADLGAPEPLGPWSSIGEAATYIHVVLELYAKKEGTAWKQNSASP